MQVCVARESKRDKRAQGLLASTSVPDYIVVDVNSDEVPTFIKNSSMQIFSWPARGSSMNMFRLSPPPRRSTTTARACLRSIQYNILLVTLVTSEERLLCCYRFDTIRFLAFPPTTLLPRWARVTFLCRTRYLSYRSDLRQTLLRPRPTQTFLPKGSEDCFKR